MQRNPVLYQQKSLPLVKFLLFFSFIVLVFSSCIPQKETVYLQNKKEKKNYSDPYSELTTVTERYVLRPNDQLFIQVNTSNPKISEFFNPSRSGGGGNSQQNQSLYTYPVDDNMNIDFPFVGKVNFGGLTLQQAKEKMETALEPFVSDAHVKMRLASNSFVILGEVGSPGRIDMGKEQITIYEAVALAGDIRTFGKRSEIKIVRPKGDAYETFFVDITDNNLVGSDEYYVYPNDLIYVRPMKAKSFGIGETFSFGIVSSVLALYLTIRAISQ
ncbi:polysaccharide biosynthesis/export family protein [Marinilabilia rubra]|uniref:Sugar transporter n=1 Tax=Marinilabilia rubra TaxID=2162893 RepID=A0A2U2BAD6_9BACT|nr:polysaccharide biosynthesis/export family protein [Marinilabilia rubra]PWE00035.1 sugar transporter [Marinilabilia rubra]